MMSAVEQAAAAFAPPPAGTPIEDRLHTLEEALQCVVMVLAASSAPPERTPTRPTGRRHLHLVTDAHAEN